MNIDKLKCDEVKNLEDIQGIGTTSEHAGRNPKDQEKVSCLQTHYKDKSNNKQEYNELKEMIKKYFVSSQNDSNLYKAFCLCCKAKVKGKKISTPSFSNFRNDTAERDSFYKCLEEKGFYKKK